MYACAPLPRLHSCAPFCTLLFTSVGRAARPPHAGQHDAQHARDITPPPRAPLPPSCSLRGVHRAHWVCQTCFFPHHCVLRDGSSHVCALRLPAHTVVLSCLAHTSALCEVRRVQCTRLISPPQRPDCAPLVHHCLVTATALAVVPPPLTQTSPSHNFRRHGVSTCPHQCRSSRQTAGAPESIVESRAESFRHPPTHPPFSTLHALCAAPCVCMLHSHPAHPLHTVATHSILVRHVVCDQRCKRWRIAHIAPTVTPSAADQRFANPPTPR